MTSTPVTIEPPRPATTAQLLKVLTPELARAVPKGMDADRIARLVTTEVRKSRNAKAAGIARQSLEDCTQESFAGALLTASALGLEPGVNGECYLVPYRDNKRRVVECQLIIGYQGIVKLFWQHPRAARIDAQWVGENDEFRYSKGLNPILEHTAARGDRGKPVYFYAIVEVTGAQPLWDVFTADEIKTLRRGKVGSSGDIKDPQHWMERKTALKQVLKLAPKTTRLDSAIRSDDQPGTHLSRSQAMELPPSVQATPDYIDGEVADISALSSDYGSEPDNPQVHRDGSVDESGQSADDPAKRSARDNWMDSLHRLFVEADCPDPADQLIVVSKVAKTAELLRLDAITDKQLRDAVSQLGKWSKAGELGSRITDILNSATLAEAEAEAVEPAPEPADA